MKKNIFKIAIVVGVLYFLFMDIDLDKVIVSILEISWVGLLFTIISLILGDIFFSLRWRMLLFGRCSLLASFESVMISSFFNFILPAKLGEVSKVLYLKKIYNIAISDTTAITIIEKFFDLFWISVLALVASLYIFDDSIMGMSALGFIGGIILVGFLVKSNKLITVLNKIPFKFLRIYSKKVIYISKRRLRSKIIFQTFVITGIIWLFYFFSNYLFFNYAFSFALSISQVSMVVIVSIIAMSIPLTPGGIGIYQAGLVAILTFYGVDKELALVSGILFHILAILLSGLFTLVIFFIRGEKLYVWKKS